MAKLGLEGSFDPKRSGSRGFHEGIFDHGFGGFSTVKKRGKRNSGANFVAKRIPEMTSRGIGIDGDAFTGSHTTSHDVTRRHIMTSHDEFKRHT